MFRRVPRLIGALAVLIALITLAVPSAAPSAGALVGGPKPTVVLVHGSFADASGWTAERPPAVRKIASRASASRRITRGIR